MINTPESCIHLLKRIRKNNILISSNNSPENLPSEKTDQFLKLVEERNTNGILISQRSGIVLKKDYHIDIINNWVVLFFDNMDFSPIKLELAVSVIDTLSEKLRQYGVKLTGGDQTIPKEVLDLINTEYQLFISQKTAVIEVFKESQRKVLSQIDEIRFPNLDKFLSTKYTSVIQKTGFKCDLCKSFTGNNLKALAAHKRGCIRKDRSNTLIESVIN
jgi:hypothetical protein